MKRTSKITFNRSGAGSISGKAIIPAEWLRDMGITPENREVIITYKYGKLIIEKAPKEI